MNIKKELLGFIPFLVFAFIIWCKNVYFVISIFPNILLELSSFAIIRIFSTYAAVACIISFFCFLYFQKIISWIVLLLTDLWLLANLLYYRSYHDLINIWCLDSIGQLSLYDGIILPYCTIGDILLLLTTLAWVGMTFSPKLFTHPLINRLTCIIGIVLTLLLSSPWIITTSRANTVINPFHSYYHDVSMGRGWYALTFSPIIHGINELLALPKLWDSHQSQTTIVELENHIKEQVATNSNCNVVIVLFESLESWVVDTTIYENNITKNINSLIKDTNTLFIKATIPQVKMGRSADAQLITLTGLLPIDQGVTCMRYMNNTYPSLVKAAGADFKKIYVPTPASAWNQGAMTTTFGFDHLYAETVSDRTLVNLLLREVMNKKDSSFFVVMTTMASHVPFEVYADSSDLSFPKNYEYAKYLQTINYTDECLKPLIDYCVGAVERSTLLVITGDHTTHNSPMSTSVPLIMHYSNRRLKTNIDTALQTDIYPTILDAMGCKEYYWGGVGMNLLDEFATRKNNANEISNVIIKTNFFKDINM
jgi:phosphoglycerol transferase MdoB-like AlkP superfamily enzyme